MEKIDKAKDDIMKSLKNAKNFVFFCIEDNTESVIASYGGSPLRIASAILTGLDCNPDVRMLIKMFFEEEIIKNNEN